MPTLDELRKAARRVSLEPDETKIEKERSDARASTVEPVSVDQSEAGNYKKGRFRWNGFEVVIEYPKGKQRTKRGKDGKTWSRMMQADYGSLRRTFSDADGDSHDVYLGPDLSSPVVYVVDQAKADGEFDESKHMLGYWSAEEAKKSYLSHYPVGWEKDRFLGITALTLQQFREWVRSGDSSRPMADQMVKIARAVELCV